MVLPFRIREDCRQHGRARVHGALVRVVEIEYMRADAVYERGVQRVNTFGAAPERRLLLARKRFHATQRVLDRLVARRPDCAAECVQRRAACFMADFGRNIFIARGDQKRGERCRCAHSTLAPDALTTFAHFDTSDRMYAPTCCGVPDSGSAPCA